MCFILFNLTKTINNRTISNLRGKEKTIKIDQTDTNLLQDVKKK